MVSTPGYDPNALDQPGVYTKLATDDANSPLLNRATQGGYVPGSTMKVVTAAAALDSGKFTPDSMVDGKSPIDISGTPLSNFSNSQYGPITLTTALTNSVNTVWAQVAEQLGNETMADYMERFGFGDGPADGLPRRADAPERGARPQDAEAHLAGLEPASTSAASASARSASRVTPLQMATVAATVANGGVRMEPHLTNRVVDEDGRTVERIEPKEAERVIDAASARELTVMMSNVVREGTGVGAALEGIEVAGKTGTAELNIEQRINQPWFIGFAPLDAPKVAIAVTVERVQGPQSQGGAVAAPIAKVVMQELLK